MNIKLKEQELFKLLKDKNIQSVHIPDQVPQHSSTILDKDTVFLKRVFYIFENLVKNSADKIDDISFEKSGNTLKINVKSSKDSEFHSHMRSGKEGSLD